MLSTVEEDYSDYLKHLSNLINIMSLCSGFLFTSYTILITRLPDPSIITAQLTLLILSVYLSICLFCLGMFARAAFDVCRNVPPLSKSVTIANILFFIAATTAMSVAATLMSLLWNLTYLALVQTIQWVLFVVATYFFVIKPSWKLRKSKGAARTS